jgi:hypothetical protein
MGGIIRDKQMLVGATTDELRDKFWHKAAFFEFAKPLRISCGFECFR